VTGWEMCFVMCDKYLSVRVKWLQLQVQFIIPALSLLHHGRPRCSQCASAPFCAFLFPRHSCGSTISSFI